MTLKKMTFNFGIQHFKCEVYHTHIINIKNWCDVMQVLPLMKKLLIFIGPHL